MTFSFPDDVAQYLEGIEDRKRSAHVAEAMRARMAFESMRELLAVAGDDTNYDYDPTGAIRRATELKIRLERLAPTAQATVEKEPLQ
jgi:hypothetical protein